MTLGFYPVPHLFIWNPSTIINKQYIMFKRWCKMIQMLLWKVISLSQPTNNQPTHKNKVYSLGAFILFWCLAVENHAKHDAHWCFPLRCSERRAAGLCVHVDHRLAKGGGTAPEEGRGLISLLPPHLHVNRPLVGWRLRGLGTLRYPEPTCM